MKRFLNILFSFLFFNQIVNAQSELGFNNIDSLFKYAENHSYSIKTGEQQVLLAKWQQISAKAGIVNFRMQTSFSLTNNLELPVTYLPAEAFGGTPGTFKEITTGQQYMGNFNIAPQIDIINPSSWAKLKSANINADLADVNNLIAKKALFESISACYFNIISLQEQSNITQNTLYTADTILLIMQNKYDEGQVRQQDLNDAIINQLSLADKLEQIKLSLNQQYYSLKILCDIPETTKIVIEHKLNYNQQFGTSLQLNNQLQYQLSVLKAELAKSDLRTNNLSQLPTLSFVMYDSWQQNSAEMFFDKDTRWLNSQYIGLRVSMPFPDVNKYILSKNSKINKKIALLNEEHTKLQNNLANAQIDMDYSKAYSQFTTTKQIYLLKDENYHMAMNQFKMSILPSDRLLIAFNDMLVSRLNYSSALANLLYTKSKIDINNTIK
ncbi:MAG: TolC family protein [Bacteroidales bacterium]|jgi:outer membrane protein TolC|nr:TolC family protein [Bacteroidales bacterium]